MEHVKSLIGSEHLFDLQSGFQGGGVIEVGLHASIFIVAETEADVLGEVGMDEIRGEPALGGLPGDDGGNVAFPVGERVEKVLGVGRGDELGAAAPDGEDHGEAGEFLPFLAKVESEKGEGGGIEMQGGVADDQRGVIVREHVVKEWFGDGYNGVGVELTAEDHAGEHDGSPGAAVHSEGSDLCRGDLGDEQNGANGAIAGDAGTGEGGQGLAGHFDDREEADIVGPGLDTVCAFGGEAVVQMERVAARTVLETPNQRDRVEIGNDGDAWAGGVRMHLDIQGESLSF